MQLLLQTRPWVRFLSVLAFIASAFMLLAGVLGLVGGLAGMAAVNAMGHKGVPSGFAFLSLLYIPFAFLAIYPGMKLWAYGSAISRLALSRSPQDLEAAIGHQKSYWKFAGIMAIVVIILQVIGIGIAMVAGAALFSQLPNQ
ncbi:MAG: DUF5362 family protein [Polyangiaceae bacterium]|nr:DUF5362 family protein [Polyangiaceae bacterium]